MWATMIINRSLNPVRSGFNSSYTRPTLRLGGNRGEHLGLSSLSTLQAFGETPLGS